jgi:hypothetical protein
MDLAPFSTFGAVIAGANAALDCRLHRPAIEDRGGRHFFASFRDSEHGAQIMDERLEYSGFEPASHLLIDSVPGRQIVRHHSPG